MERFLHSSRRMPTLTRRGLSAALPSILAACLTSCLLLAWSCDAAVQSQAAEPASDSGDRDYLVGWYRMSNARGTLIPVFKVGNNYYSVMRKGAEVPMAVCPEGLTSDLTPSSVEGTVIAQDKTTGAYYIRLVDRVRENIESGFISGEKHGLERVDKPPKLLDPTAKPPRDRGDFLGWYQPIWWPAVRWEIRRKGEKYWLSAQGLDRSGGESKKAVWKTMDKSEELVPHPDRPGFIIISNTDHPGIVYNKDRKRYELVLEDRKRDPSTYARVPLARISPTEESNPVQPALSIGIPCWD